MKKIDTIILTIGYAESQKLFPLIFECQNGIVELSSKEALSQLANDLYALYKSERRFNINFIDWICRLPLRDLDSYPFEGVEINNNFHWFNWAPSLKFLNAIKNNTFLKVDAYGESLIPLIIESKEKTFVNMLDDVHIYPYPENYPSLDEWLNAYINMHVS